MSHKKLIKEIKPILKKLNIKYRFDKNSDQRSCYPADSEIIIGTKDTLSRNWFLTTIFHEIAHILNYRNKKYFKYHNYGKNTKITKQFDKDTVRLIVKAEIYTDQVAEKLMKEYFPKGKFQKFYSTPAGIAFLKTEIIPWYRDQIKNNDY